MSWFYLALLAPLLYAIVNLIDDNLVRFVNKGPYFVATVAGIFGATPLISRLFIGTQPMSLKLTIFAVLAGFFTVLYYFFYLKALESEQPSIVIALFGLVPATLPFLAHSILHEQLIGAQIIGLAIVLIASLGLVITDFKKLKFSKAIVLILSSVVLLDAISIMTKYVYQQVPFYPAYMYFSVGMGLGGLYFLLVMLMTRGGNSFRQTRQSLKKFILLFIIGELINLGAEISLNLAVSRGPVSLVRVIESIQPIYVLLIAILLYPVAPKYFREAAETGRTKKFILMGIIIIGLIIIGVASK